MRTVASSAFQFIKSDTEIIREIARKLKQAASELDQANLPSAYFNYSVKSSPPHLRRGIAHVQTGGVNYTLRSYASVLRRYASDVRATSNRIEDASEAFEKCESRLKQRNVLQSSSNRVGAAVGTIRDRRWFEMLTPAQLMMIYGVCPAFLNPMMGTMPFTLDMLFPNAKQDSTHTTLSFLTKITGAYVPGASIFTPFAEYFLDTHYKGEADIYKLVGVTGKSAVNIVKTVVKRASNVISPMASGVFSGVGELIGTGFTNYGKVVSGEMEADNAIVNTIGAGATAFALNGLLSFVAGPAAPAIYIGLDTLVKHLTGDSIAAWGGKGLEAVWNAGEAAGKATAKWLQGLGRSVGESQIYKEVTQIASNAVNAVQTGVNTIVGAASEAVSNVKTGLTTVCNWFSDTVFAW